MNRFTEPHAQEAIFSTGYRKKVIARISTIFFPRHLSRWSFHCNHRASYGSFVILIFTFPSSALCSLGETTPDCSSTTISRAREYNGTFFSVGDRLQDSKWRSIGRTNKLRERGREAWRQRGRGSFSAKRSLE